MAPKRIVAVDDHPDNLDSLCTLLRLWGYEVDGAEDGQRALSLARRPRRTTSRRRLHAVQ